MWGTISTRPNIAHPDRPDSAIRTLRYLERVLVSSALYLAELILSSPGYSDLIYAYSVLFAYCYLLWYMSWSFRTQRVIADSSCYADLNHSDHEDIFSTPDSLRE